MTLNYKHEERVHNFRAAKVIVPFLKGLFNINKVIDVGCGLGTWLKVFKDCGTDVILGIDGPNVIKEQLAIREKNFISKNLESPLILEEFYDLVISLEVAEHLSDKSADIFVNSLCYLGNTILFSAAITAQGGQYHINEQPPSYWIEKFESRGFELFDILRPMFWNHPEVDWWYKQNMMIFTKDRKVKAKLVNFKSYDGEHLVHPILFENRTSESNLFESRINYIERGQKSVKTYLNWIWRAILNKFRFEKH